MQFKGYVKNTKWVILTIVESTTTCTGFKLMYHISRFAIHLIEHAIRKKLKNKQNCRTKNLWEKENLSIKTIANINKKYNCSGPPAFKSQRVGYQSNQKLLHHY